MSKRRVILAIIHSPHASHSLLAAPSCFFPAPPRFSIDLDIDAPKVAIPATDTHGAVVTQLLLDFGHFTLNTDQVSGRGCGRGSERGR